MADFTLRHFIDIFLFNVSWLESNFIYILLVIVIHLFFVISAIRGASESMPDKFYNNLAVKIDRISAWYKYPIGFVLICSSWFSALLILLFHIGGYALIIYIAKLFWQL